LRLLYDAGVLSPPVFKIMEAEKFLKDYKGSKATFKRKEVVEIMNEFLQHSVRKEATLLMTLLEAKYIVTMRGEDFTFEYIAEVGLKELGYNIIPCENTGKMLYLYAKRILRRSKKDWLNINEVI
jgi:hypothetical protein